MSKPKMLYASPFYPIKSGISQYSKELIHGLKEYFDITLLIDDYKIEENEILKFPVEIYRKGSIYKGYDIILYNIGNQPEYHSYIISALRENPGYIILHDFSLYYLSIGIAQKNDDVFQSIFRLAGIEGIQLVKDNLKENEIKDLLQHKQLADKLPLNREIIRASKGVLVHSKYAKKLIENVCPEVSIKVIKLPFYRDSNSINIEEERKRIWKKWGVPLDSFLLGSGGFIAPNKQNRLVCQAVNLYNSIYKKKIYYIMIGEGNDVDDLLNEYCIKTGYLPENEYNSTLKSLDLIFNLRFPTNGETSGPLIQALGWGKPCIITDIGWYSELPDNIVIKLEPNITPEQIVERLLHIDKQELFMLGKLSKEYIRNEYSLANVSRSIKDYFLTESIQRNEKIDEHKVRS